MIHWEDESPLQMKLSVEAWWNLLPVVRGHTLMTREVITHHLL
jgi:hypothetical protein